MAEYTQAEVDLLDVEYQAYVERLKRGWLAENRVESRDVYEVMSRHDRAKVDSVITRWKAYITPLAEAWWRERGYDVIWPEDDSQPMQLRKPTS